jgi:hypothetical protein
MAILFIILIWEVIRPKLIWLWYYIVRKGKK